MAYSAPVLLIVGAAKNLVLGSIGKDGQGLYKDFGLYVVNANVNLEDSW